ncbi:DNA alkylation repair protein [Micrococcaceae bacterium Sec5.7]
MSDAGEFIDAALQREGDWYRAQDARGRLGSELRFFGASVGAVRGTVRDAGRRHPGLTHDQITALSSELWAVPVFERRLAAIVLLQSNVRLLTNSDLTRMESFVRDARLRALVDPLAVDVIGPMIEELEEPGRTRAEGVLDRWAADADIWLRRAAVLSPLRALRAGADGWAGFTRRAAMVLAGAPGAGEDGIIVREAVALVLDEMPATH